MYFDVDDELNAILPVMLLRHLGYFSVPCFHRSTQALGSCAVGGSFWRVRVVVHMYHQLRGRLLVNFHVDPGGEAPKRMEPTTSKRTRSPSPLVLISEKPYTL